MRQILVAVCLQEVHLFVSYQPLYIPQLIKERQRNKRQACRGNGSDGIYVFFLFIHGSSEIQNIKLELFGVFAVFDGWPEQCLTDTA